MKFTAKKIMPLGDNDPKYGQRYWGAVEESDMPVSFNLMIPVDIIEGTTLEFEERLIKETGPNSKKPGTEYLFLKKVKVEGRALEATKTAPSSNLEGKIDAIAGDVKLLLSFVRQLQKGEKEVDTVVEDIGDGPIDMSAIPF